MPKTYGVYFVTIEQVIELLTGENSFQIGRVLQQRKTAFVGIPEVYEGSELGKAHLMDIFGGQTLFAINRLVVVHQPSESADLWQQLEAWVAMLPSTTHVILVEPKLDKRTAAYKWLKKNVTIAEHTVWSERDSARAEQWVKQIAKESGTQLTSEIARLVIKRVGYNQWSLYNAVQKVALLDDITITSVSECIEARPDENVFSLLENALQGSRKELHRQLSELQQTEDPYRLFGLLSSQVVQAAALATTKGTLQNVAQDFSASPYVLGQLAPYAERLSPSGTTQLVAAFALADRQLKSTGASPWLIIETALMKSAYAGNS